MENSLPMVHEPNDNRLGDTISLRKQTLLMRFALPTRLLEAGSKRTTTAA